MMNHLIAHDPLERFCAIQQGLLQRGDWRNHAAWQRFAALTAILCPLAAEETAQAITETARALRDTSPWYSDLSSPLRFVVAAVLVADGIEATAFINELPSDHQTFRELGVRHGGHFETLAILILRHLNHGRPLERWRVERLKHLYEGLKRHHWWLTGPDDLPACACLSGIAADPDEIAARVDLHYQKLHQRGFQRGNHLLIASSLLALGGRAPEAAVLTFDRIAAALGKAESTVWHEDYEAIALLTLLDHDPALIAARHSQTLDRFVSLHPPLTGQAAINLAAHLVTIDLMRCDARGIRLHTADDLTHMLDTLNRVTAASLLLSTAADSLISGDETAWPLGSVLYPLGGGP